MSQQLKRGVSRHTDPVRHQAQAQVRQQVIAEASQIYAAPSAAGASERLAGWAAKWGEAEPKAVENLQRDFEETLGYYQVTGLEWKLIRTTSLLERTN